MNRVKKEEVRRYREAREGLTPEEAAEVDRREAAENAVQARVSSLNVRLFPEEYDHCYDYIARTYARPKALGFGPYGSDDTSARDWVERMLRDGREGALQELCAKFGL